MDSLSDFIAGCRIYVDVLTGKICRQTILLTWYSIIGQFLYLVGEGGVKWVNWGHCYFSKLLLSYHQKI